MKQFWNTIQLVFSALGGWLGYFLGGCDGLLYALIAFVVIDYLTGVMCAITDKKLSSAVGFKGIFRKVLIFLLVGIANVIDVEVIGTGAVLRTAVIFFYISNEGVSIWDSPSRKKSEVYWNSCMTELRKRRNNYGLHKQFTCILHKLKSQPLRAEDAFH